MANNTHRLTTLVVALAALLATAPGTSAERLLEFDARVTMRHAPTGTTGRVRLSGTLRDNRPATFDPAADDVSVRVGDTTIFALPPAAERGKVRRVRRGKWRYRGPRSEGRPRLVVNLRRATVKLRVRRADLNAFDRDAHTPTDVVVDLRRMTYRSSGEMFPARRGLAFAASGGVPGLPPTFVFAGRLGLSFQQLEAKQSIVIRTAADWAALFESIPDQPPQIDFAEDMVLVSPPGCAGRGSELPVVSHNQWFGLNVRWRHTADSCVAPLELPSPPPSDVLAVWVRACPGTINFQISPSNVIEVNR